MVKAPVIFISVISVVVLTACGGGGSGTGSSTSPSSVATFAQTYTSSATAGEILNYSVDTAALTYSYEITKSSYGCDVPTAPCHSGSGKLVRNEDGTFSPSTSLTSKVFALQNGLLVGSVVLPLGGSDRRVPVFGISNPATSVTELAGTYNFMSLQCNGKTYGTLTGCETYQGTVAVTSEGTFTSCVGGNLAATNHTCSSTTTGTATSMGGGIFALQATTPANGTSTNYLVGFKAPNGQKVGFLDFNDPIVYGYGQAVISSLVTTSVADVVGKYMWANVYGSAGTVALNSNGTTSSGYTATTNIPWDGLSTISSDGIGAGYGLIAGNGVYVYRNPAMPNKPAYLEIGLRYE
jgi:hypothetical protein